jgi:protein phosphatase
MVAAVWPRAYLVQVGDSRCYRLRDGTLERMSQDQTMAQALVEQGALSPSDAEQSPLRNLLASALGGTEARPVTAATDIRWDDVMLMCTDGLTKHVPEAEIEGELRATTSAEASCRRLVDLALERGGTDNVTVLVSRLRPRRPPGT